MVDDFDNNYSDDDYNDDEDEEDTIMNDYSDPKPIRHL
jgi:hypothetical protein